jgi:hypothetical protein
MSSRNLVEAAVRRGLPRYAELSDAGMRFIVDRLTLKYHQGASLDEVEQRAPRLLMAAEAFDAEQKAARAAARRNAANRRVAEARERAKNPLPASLDLGAMASAALFGRAAGRRPTKGQINALAERLQLAWHQGASVAALEALAGELAAGRGW